jgi:hypothetical protein
MGLLSITHVHNNTTSIGPSRIDVHEHRAPTDESIKIYNEMLLKAKDQIMQEVHIHNNIIEGCVFCFINSIDAEMNRKIVSNYKFKINGKEYKGEMNMSQDDIFEKVYPKMKFDKMAYARYAHELLTKEIAKRIAENMLEPVIDLFKTI